jgi:hypothetical protein
MDVHFFSVTLSLHNAQVLSGHLPLDLQIKSQCAILNLSHALHLLIISSLIQLYKWHLVKSAVDDPPCYITLFCTVF